GQSSRANCKIAIQRSSVVERSAVNDVSEHFHGLALLVHSSKKSVFRGKTAPKCAISNASHAIPKSTEQYHKGVTMKFRERAKAFNARVRVCARARTIEGIAGDKGRGGKRLASLG